MKSPVFLLIVLPILANFGGWRDEFPEDSRRSSPEPTHEPTHVECNTFEPTHEATSSLVDTDESPTSFSTVEQDQEEQTTSDSGCTCSPYRRWRI